MQTQLTEAIKNTANGKIAEKILRNCVHCGFCNATCPTYLLLGNENDGPRGRIYLIKQLLEGQESGEKTLKHLDRCLTCRNCETTCPSGVEYSKLLDIGREVAEKQISRPKNEVKIRKRLRTFLPYTKRFKTVLTLGRTFKFLLPKATTAKIPQKKTIGEWPEAKYQRKMLALAGCVQAAVTPETNAATARVLSRLGIDLLEAKNAGCCGAVSQHLTAPKEAKQFIRNNIDAWWPYIKTGVEAIVMTASGCGSMVKDYGYILRHDPNYAAKAKKVSSLCKDLSEILINERYQIFTRNDCPNIVWHPPCTLQHGQKITGVVETLLRNIGYQLKPIANSHLCCGSAGTYSILQPELSEQLRNQKLNSLLQQAPDIIVTANVGCQVHLQEKTKTPVQHWVHLLDQSV
jgi:glycolate oxidase iron-sulfur subunit